MGSTGVDAQEGQHRQHAHRRQQPTQEQDHRPDTQQSPAVVAAAQSRQGLGSQRHRHQRRRVGPPLQDRRGQQRRDEHRVAKVDQRPPEGPHDGGQVQEGGERQMTAADVLGNEPARHNDRRRENLLGDAAPLVGDQGPRAQGPCQQVGEDPDLHAGGSRQPEERQQEERPGERRLGILKQHDPAAVVGVPRRKLMEVHQGDAGALPQGGELSPIVGATDPVQAELAGAPRRAEHDHRRHQQQRDRDSRGERPDPRVLQPLLQLHGPPAVLSRLLGLRKGSRPRG